MFLEGESQTLKTFNNCTIIMTKNSDKIRILWVWCFVSLAYFWVDSAGCSGEFHVVSKHFKNLEKLIWNILKKKLRIPWLKGFFSWQRCKVFRIAQCKQPRLGKPYLNSDLYFISKTSGTALLETIVSYKPLPSTSLYIDNITAFMCIFSSILNCS